jgi:gliding motility-associated-like protein
MQIYNRWGEVVFQSDDPAEGWNGRKYNTGEILPEGIYLYVVRYQSFTGKETILNNYITLIR